MGSSKFHPFPRRGEGKRQRKEALNHKQPVKFMHRGRGPQGFERFKDPSPNEPEKVFCCLESTI